jgi:hypothetical protein
MRWVFLATDNIASLTNANHGRPVFFNLQINIADAVGWQPLFRRYWRVTSRTATMAAAGREP